MADKRLDKMEQAGEKILNSASDLSATMQVLQRVLNAAALQAEETQKAYKQSAAHERHGIAIKDLLVQRMSRDYRIQQNAETQLRKYLISNRKKSEQYIMSLAKGGYGADAKTQKGAKAYLPQLSPGGKASMEAIDNYKQHVRRVQGVFKDMGVEGVKANVAIGQAISKGQGGPYEEMAQRMQQVQAISEELQLTDTERLSLLKQIQNRYSGMIEPIVKAAEEGKNLNDAIDETAEKATTIKAGARSGATSLAGKGIAMPKSLKAAEKDAADGVKEMTRGQRFMSIGLEKLNNTLLSNVKSVGAAEFVWAALAQVLKSLNGIRLREAKNIPILMGGMTARYQTEIQLNEELNTVYNNNRLAMSHMGTAYTEMYENAQQAMASLGGTYKAGQQGELLNSFIAIQQAGRALGMSFEQSTQYALKLDRAFGKSGMRKALEDMYHYAALADQSLEEFNKSFGDVEDVAYRFGGQFAKSAGRGLSAGGAQFGDKNLDSNLLRRIVQSARMSAVTQDTKRSQGMVLAMLGRTGLAQFQQGGGSAEEKMAEANAKFMGIVLNKSLGLKDLAALSDPRNAVKKAAFAEAAGQVYNLPALTSKLTFSTAAEIKDIMEGLSRTKTQDELDKFARDKNLLSPEQKGWDNMAKSVTIEEKILGGITTVAEILGNALVSMGRPGSGGLGWGDVPGQLKEGTRKSFGA